MKYKNNLNTQPGWGSLEARASNRYTVMIPGMRSPTIEGDTKTDILDPELLMRFTMQTNRSQTSIGVSSVCRNCCFYQPQGHNGGTCHQLNVAVSGNWPTCQLTLPAFAPTWQILDDLPVQTETPATATEAPLLFEKLEARETKTISFSSTNN